MSEPTVTQNAAVPAPMNPEEKDQYIAFLERELATARASLRQTEAVLKEYADTVKERAEDQIRREVASIKEDAARYQLLRMHRVDCSRLNIATSGDALDRQLDRRIAEAQARGLQPDGVSIELRTRPPASTQQ